jgi:hypothetical protein
MLLIDKNFGIIQKMLSGLILLGIGLSIIGLSVLKKGGKQERKEFKSDIEKAYHSRVIRQEDAETLFQHKITELTN